MSAEENSDIRNSKKESLLSGLLTAVQGCQVRFGGRAELATETDERVASLCTSLESALSYGLKPRSPNRGLAAIKQVKDIVTSGLNLHLTLPGGDTEAPVLWWYVRELLTRHEYERFLLLKNVNTDLGRGRAWIRSLLNEHSLERYMHILVCDEKLLLQWYEPWALLRDMERAAMLPNLAAASPRGRPGVVHDLGPSFCGRSGRTPFLRPGTRSAVRRAAQALTSRCPSLPGPAEEERFSCKTPFKTGKKCGRTRSCDDDGAQPRHRYVGGCGRGRIVGPRMLREDPLSQAKKPGGLDSGDPRPAGGSVTAFARLPARAFLLPSSFSPETPPSPTPADLLHFLWSCLWRRFLPSLSLFLLVAYFSLSLSV
ncbi:putative sorting nexin-29-like [Penaeus vannamei]|uniref:Putative sorting nexin-29-like n=1 Tax=Penaeus vannamei TaxID=6689 RepID=A0A3R7Q4M1_PENVA|nr:putative sorting nexin-29-like [Penaeus vannamei]